MLLNKINFIQPCSTKKKPAPTRQGGGDDDGDAEPVPGECTHLPVFNQNGGSGADSNCSSSDSCSLADIESEDLWD